MKEEKKFTPYVTDNQKVPEITPTSILTGIILAVVFGAANAYLGLRVGLTVSASIPAAVIALGVIRIFLKRKSVLESNIVQTIGSAGESVAAGAIFTLPALFLWAAEGKIEKPGIWEITLIALIGGLLGVFFMIPLRNALIVKEHNNLPYPEGTACAKVLLSGEQSAKGATSVFSGIGTGALLKIFTDGLKLAKGEISLRIKGFAGEIGTQVYPAVFSVGYICGPKISAMLFSGGVLSWLVLIPLIVLFGENSVIAPGENTISEIYLSGGASAVWSTYIRYIGAGALAAGGIISLLKTMPLIVKTFGDSLKGFKISNNSDEMRTNRQLGTMTMLICTLALTVFMWIIPAIPISLTGAVIVAVFGFLFAAVSSRMVGIVGSSNNPVSGMSIATLLIATLLLKSIGTSGNTAMASAIAIGSVICIISAISGDTSQDLKTGFLLGATPKKQQIAEIVGVVCASLSTGATLYLLDGAWGFGSEELAAPQATLMKMIVEGVMTENLPWALVFSGAFIAIAAELMGVPVLPFAIGIYLPIHLNSCILLGGLTRLLFDHLEKRKPNPPISSDKGILFCSGMIAGEGLAGVGLAFLALSGLGDVIDFSGLMPEAFLNISSVAVLAIIFLLTIVFSGNRDKKV